MHSEVPEREWRSFFESFTRAHRGHLCALSLFDSERQQTLRLSPLLLGAVDSHGEGAYADPRIRVLLWDWYGDRLAHVIGAPSHVFVDAGADLRETLAIDGPEGRTVLSFDAAS
jgi:hypothetical protein